MTMKTKATVTLDVRPDIQAGRHPCAKITEAAESLKTGETLRLIAPFEPVPLYAVMARRGFTHETGRAEDGGWEVWFTSAPERAGDCTATAHEPSPGCGCSPLPEIDARGLEPPQPLVRIVEALATVPRGGGLRAHTDRNPVHLHELVVARGYTAHTEEQPDGSHVTTIRRP